MNESGKRIVRVQTAGEAHYGFWQDADMIELAEGPLEALNGTGRCIPLDSCRLLAPVGAGKLVIVASNYTESRLPDRTQPRKPPVFVLKPATSVAAPGDHIVYPDDTNTVHYETEVGVVIGKPAKRVSAETAMQYVLGYTLVNDVTDRENLDGQWTFGKGRDTFLPVGPCIVTELDEEDQYAEGILNGELVQRVDTQHLTHAVPELIAWISAYMTLMPGDLICTGTSHGGGALHVGDEFVVRNSRIGTLRNRIVRD